MPQERRSISVLAILAVLRGNDALLLKGKVIRDTRVIWIHFRAPHFFKQLLVMKPSLQKYSGFRKELKELIDLKSSVEYKGGELSRSGFERIIRNTRRFVRDCVDRAIEGV